MGFTTFGEIMLRLTPNDHAGKINSSTSFGVHYAGSESNVASSLAVLGNDVREKAMKAIIMAKKKFGLPQVAFTVREHNSASANGLSGVYLTTGEPLVSNSYGVEILDRFGTGDAFAAAFLHGLNKGWPPEETIGFATAAFALKHTIKGDQHTSVEKEIRSIFEGHTSGHVLR